MRQIPTAAGGILSYFVRHRTVANLLLLLLLVAGFASIPNMRAQFFPDVIIDNVLVTVPWDGAGAEDVDAGIVQIIEPGLLAVEGVKSSSSLSSEGAARITLEFEPGWDMGRATDDVQTAIDQLSSLPDEADEPVVRRGAWRDRVTDVIITGPVGPEQLGLFADEFVVRLFARGVTRTTIQGVAAPQTLVEVPSLGLIANDVTMAEIAAAIKTEVDAKPAGDVTGANARVRTGTEKRSPVEISNIVLRNNLDGSKLRIGDVATVLVLGSNRNRSYFVRDDPAVSIRVDRSNQGDALAIQDIVEEIAADFEATLPPTVSLELIRTRAEAISGRLNILINNGLLGLGLVLILLFLFLNARTAFWVAAGIPVAMSAAIALMYAGNLTINMVSLFGLIITLGIVVDDAIVVGEHADFRYRTLGEPPMAAAENAARRMALPVFAAMVTTVIAFFGLMAVGGRFGSLIRDIPITVIFVLIASLIECFLILPHHMGHALIAAGKAKYSSFKLGIAAVSLLILSALFSGALFFVFWPEVFLSWVEALPYLALGPTICVSVFLISSRNRKAEWLAHMGTKGLDTPSAIVNLGFEWMRNHLFRPFMTAVIMCRYVVLAAVCVVLASQIALLIQGDVKWRFFNAPERGSVTGNFAMVEGATRADTLAMMREMQRATENLSVEYEKKHGRNPIDYVISEIGGNSGRGLSGADSKNKDLLGGISIELIDADLRPYSSFAFVADLQDAVVHHPLVETVNFRGWRSGPGGDALDVEFFGADTNTLKEASEDLKRALLQFPEVSAVEDNLAYDKEELILDLTAQGQAMGFNIDQLGRILRNRLNGIEAATYPAQSRSAEIRVALPVGELTADFLERTQMRTPAGIYVPLADIVSVERRTGFSTVRRENGVRLVNVSGDISEDDAVRATEINEALARDILPNIAIERQVEYFQSGLSEDENEFLSDALNGLLLVLLGIYIVLAWVFSSWARPIVVMAIIPFGLVGTIYGHALWNVPLSMFTVVGLLGMTGIIINDSIVLVTTIDSYAKVRGLVPSIIDGASDRLRPVMLTTMTTVLGMAPLLYEQSQQAQFLKPTVITLVYGLGFGLLLVLLIVPALIAVQHDVARQIAAMRRGVFASNVYVRWGFSSLWIIVLFWFLATLGFTIIVGEIPALIVNFLPIVSTVSPISAALLLFSAGVIIIAVVAYLFAAIGWQIVRLRAS